MIKNKWKALIIGKVKEMMYSLWRTGVIIAGYSLLCWFECVITVLVSHYGLAVSFYTYYDSGLGT